MMLQLVTNLPRPMPVSQPGKVRNNTTDSCETLLKFDDDATNYASLEYIYTEPPLLLNEIYNNSTKISSDELWYFRRFTSLRMLNVDNLSDCISCSKTNISESITLSVSYF
jgi:hypothetical protein